MTFRRVISRILVVALCLGEVAVLGGGVVAEASRESLAPAVRGDAGSDGGWPVSGLVPDADADSVSEARVAPACDPIYDNGTPGDSSDDYSLKSSSVDSNGDRTCVYTREVSRVVSASPVPCAKTQPGDFKLQSQTDEECVYKRTPYTERDARKSTSYSCDPRSGWKVKLQGSLCVYSKETTVRLAPIPPVYKCDPVATFGPGVLNGKTCTYTRSGSTTLPAKVAKRYRCPPSPPTFKLSDIDYNSGQCVYTRSGRTTLRAKWVPMFGFYCPSPPATYTYHKRDGDTCYYTRTTTTGRAYETYEAYTCPSAPATYSPDGRSGKTCRYKRSTSTTHAATVKAPSKCPPVPAGHRWGHRSGDDCYYHGTETERRAARSKTTYSCPSNVRLVGTKCRTSRSGTKTIPRVYECPNARAGETLTESGSGKSKTCTYKKTETLKKIKKAPKPPIRLATPTGVKANGDSVGEGGRGKSFIEWDSVVDAKEYTVVVKPVDGKTGRTHTWTGSATSVTIRDLLLNNLFSIRVQALMAGSRSSWSQPAYTYPTLLPAQPGDLIGIVPIVHYRPTKSYDYILCTNRAPDAVTQFGTIPQWSSIITKATMTWSSITKEVSVKTTRVGKCQEDELNVDRKGNVIQIVDPLGMISYGCDPTDVGCAKSWVNRGGKVVYTRIGIYAEVAVTKEGKSCSHLFRIAMHEVGHAFGLYHPDGNPNESVMHMPDQELCNPTGYDLVAIMAVYQSR